MNGEWRLGAINFGVAFGSLAVVGFLPTLIGWRFAYLSLSLAVATMAVVQVNRLAESRGWADAE